MANELGFTEATGEVAKMLGVRFLESNPSCAHSDNRCLYYGGGCDTAGTNPNKCAMSLKKIRTCAIGSALTSSLCI